MGIRTIVVGTDLRGSGERALKLARKTAQSTHATLWLVHALASESSVDELEQLRRLCERDGLSAQTSCEHGEPWETILRSALAVKADLIVVGEHDSSVGQAPRELGSTAERIVHQAPCSVLVACGRLREDYGAARLAVGVDFSSHSIEAVRWARDVARAVGGSVALVHVEPKPTIGGLSSAARPRLEQLVRSEGLDAGTLVHVAEGPVGSSLCEAAEQLEADVLFVGCRGRDRHSGSVLGSCTEHCLRQSPIPVSAVRELVGRRP